jgi:hypothetical protein
LYFIKTWQHKAITKFAMAGPRGGNARWSECQFSSYSRHIRNFLEKRLQRPPPVATSQPAALLLLDSKTPRNSGSNSKRVGSGGGVPRRRRV